MSMKKLIERIDSIESKQTTTLTEGLEQGVAEGSDDLIGAVLSVIQDIYNGALAGEEMIDNVADELGDYFDDVKRSKDKTLRRAYQFMRREGGDAEGDPQKMAQVAKQAIDMLSQQGITEGFKNTYSVGDRVDSPLGTGTIVAVSKNINVDGRVRVKLDDPSRAGEDGKYKDSFVLDTTQLKHISEQGVAEGTYWAGSEGPDGIAIDDPNDVMPDKKPVAKKLGPKAKAKTQMLKMYGDGEITFRKTSNGGYFIQHEDDFGDTHSHQYDPKTGKVDFSGVTRSSYYGEGVAETERQPGRFSGAWQILVNGKKVHSFRGNFDQETADRVGVVKAADRGVYNPGSGDKIKIVPVMLDQKQSVAESNGRKPDYIDLDGDGNRKETMKKAAADKKKHKTSVKENRPPMDDRKPGTGPHRAPVGLGGNPEQNKGSKTAPTPYSKAPRKVSENVDRLLHPHFGNPNPDYMDDETRVAILIGAINKINQRGMVYDLSDQDEQDLQELMNKLEFYAKQIGSTAAEEMKKHSQRNEIAKRQDTEQAYQRERANIKSTRGAAYRAAQRGIAQMESNDSQLNEISRRGFLGAAAALGTGAAFVKGEEDRVRRNQENMSQLEDVVISGQQFKLNVNANKSPYRQYIRNLPIKVIADDGKVYLMTVIGQNVRASIFPPQMDMNQIGMSESKKSTVKESWTDFDDAKRAHEKAGSTVTGRPEDYTVTMMDGTRKRFITKDGRRKIETLPPVAARHDDDDDEAPAKKATKAAPPKEGGKKRGRPAGSKNKKKVSEMNESEFHQFMRGVMLIEERMSPEQKAEKERIVKGMKKSSKDLKKRYGSRWQDVMHATATKKAMESLVLSEAPLTSSRLSAYSAGVQQTLDKPVTPATRGLSRSMDPRQQEPAPSPSIPRFSMDPRQQEPAYDVDSRSSQAQDAVSDRQLIQRGMIQSHRDAQERERQAQEYRDALDKSRAEQAMASTGGGQGEVDQQSRSPRTASYGGDPYNPNPVTNIQTSATTPAAPAATAPAATPAAPSTYAIRSGDTLSAIARRQGTSVAELMRLNPQITNPDRIRAGQAINIAGITSTPNVYAGGVGAVADTQARIAAGRNLAPDMVAGRDFYPDSPESRRAAGAVTPATTPAETTPTVTPTSVTGASVSPLRIAQNMQSDTSAPEFQMGALQGKTSQELAAGAGSAGFTTSQAEAELQRRAKQPETSSSSPNENKINHGSSLNESVTELNLIKKLAGLSR